MRHRFRHSDPRRDEERFEPSDVWSGGPTCVLCGQWFSALRTHDFDSLVCFGVDDYARDVAWRRVHLWANARFNARHGVPFILTPEEEKLTT